jgi:acyl-CoA synthetase (NDP forming)
MRTSPNGSDNAEAARRTGERHQIQGTHRTAMTDIIASARTLRPMLEPRAVAVLGASDDPTKIGGVPLRYLREYFAGPVYAVNPTRDTVQGMPSYKSLSAIEGPVDMAIMAVPAKLAIEAAEAAAKKGVKALCTFTAGFSEVGEDGRRMQRRLADIARESGMRILGPNCLGYFNARTNLYATFSTSITHGRPRVGNVALISQSGAFGSHCFVLGRERGLGFSGCVTTGNEVDITVAECLAYFAMDDETEVLACYMEGCKDGRQFMDALALAQERGKPVVIQKVGRSAVGTEAAASHTASLTGADKVYDAVFERFNAYRADTTSELIDIAYMLSGMRRFGKLPTGNKIAIATVSGGAGVMMADAAEEAGLDVAPLPEKTQAYLKELVPFAGTRNPVDFTAQVYNDFNVVTKNFDAIYREGGYDAVIGFFTALLYSETMSKKVLDSLLPVRKAFPDRVFALSMIGPLETRRKFEQEGFLMLEDPSIAMRTIAATLKIGRGMARGPRTAPTTEGAPRIERRSYNEIDAKALLAKAGIRAAPERLAKSAEDAVRAAAEIGYPVVMKIVSPDILHKSEAGGVKLGLADADGVHTAYDAILSSCKRACPTAKIDGVLVGKMVSGGVEAILGVQRDPVFGPVVMFGLGGIFTEIMKDVTFRLAPFDADEAMEMIRAIKGFPLLDGARGRQKCDQAALAEAISKLSIFAAANRDVVASIDINPVVVLPEGEGVAALDAVILTV